MAVVLNKITGKKEETAETPAQPGQPVGGAESSMLGSAPGSAPQKTVGTGRFTNIQQYIGANTGAGQRLAGRIGEDVERSKKDVDQSLQSTSAVRDQIQAEKDRLAQAGGFAQQVQQDPTQLLGQIDAFTKLRTGQTAAGNIQQAGQQALDIAQSKLGTLQEQSRLAGTEPGRFQLLQQALGRPSYSKGQQRLDQLLVQSSGGGVLNALQRQAAEAAKRASGSLETTGKELGAGVSDITTQAKAAQEQLTGALGALGTTDDPTTPDVDESKGAGALGSLQDALRQKQSDFIKQQEALKSDIAKGLGGPGDVSLYKDQFTEDALKRLGITAGQSLYNLNLAELVQPKFESGMITEQSVATPEQLARYQALARLSGTDASYLIPGQVGTAQGLQVDPSQLQEALQSRQQQHAQLQKDMGTDNLQKYYQAQYKPKYDEMYKQVYENVLGNRFINGVVNPMYDPITADLIAKEQANYAATKFAEQQRHDYYQNLQNQLNALQPNRTARLINGGV